MRSLTVAGIEQELDAGLLHLAMAAYLDIAAIIDAYPGRSAKLAIRLVKPTEHCS